jgi:hypothetical protein
MSDNERAKILKRKTLTVVECYPDKVNVADDALLERLRYTRSTIAQPLLKKLAEEFGVFGQYANADTEISFNFSRKGLEESVFKQDKNMSDYALLLSNFKGVIENAVGIEVHSDRYKLDPTLKNVYVLVGAFSDEKRILPVKLEVKRFIDDERNKLHVAVTKTEIEKTTVYARRFGHKPGIPIPRVVSDISIRQFAKKINSFDGDLLKYFPDRLLTSPQRNAAADVRAAETVYTERKLAEQKARLAVRGQELPSDAPAPKTIESVKISELPSGVTRATQMPAKNISRTKTENTKSKMSGKDGK